MTTNFIFLKLNITNCNIISDIKELKTRTVEILITLSDFEKILFLGDLERMCMIEFMIENNIFS